VKVVAFHDIPPEFWALPLTTFNGYGTFSQPSKMRLADRTSNHQKIHVIIFSTVEHQLSQTLFSIFTVVIRMAVVLLKMISS
jgi:hypothetical protein